MLWILALVGVFGAMLTLAAAYYSYKDGEKKVTRNSLIFSAVFLPIAIISIFKIVDINSMAYEETVQTDNLELVSLADSSQIFGKVSLVYISIGTDEVYAFYYKVDDNSFKRGKVEADITTVHEMDACTPHIEEYTTYLRNKMNDNMMKFLLFSKASIPQEKTYEIYVPKGTIVQTFSLDSQ